jgi:hypothetical protein
MPVMCEECKCSIVLEDKPDGTRDYGGCGNGCPCCNEGSNPGREVLWQLNLTRAMVADWSPDEIDLLIADLDDAVQATYEDWEV